MQKNLVPNSHKYCSISNNVCYLNGIEYLRFDQSIKHEDLLLAIYKNSGITYPKFFKMDKLCKLGFLLSEILFKECEDELKQDTSIYLSNRSSCLHSDTLHQKNIQSQNAYFPSPSIFVYTLPNIVIGEICIRHKIMGEGVFFLSESPNFEDLKIYADLALQNKISKQVLIGWLETEENTMEGEFYLIKQYDK